jgi:hypothetical protein
MVAVMIGVFMLTSMTLRQCAEVATGGWITDRQKAPGTETTLPNLSLWFGTYLLNAERVVLPAW